MGDESGAAETEGETFSRDRQLTLAAFDNAVRAAEAYVRLAEEMAVRAEKFSPDRAAWYRADAAKVRETAAVIAAHAGELRARPASYE